jgi:hypothetical protein
MPPLANEFRSGVVRATSLAEAGEQARVMLSGFPRRVRPLYPARLELLYEMAFLRVFIEWETFLEQSFLRYLCGYQNVRGQQTMVHGNYYGTLVAAEVAILGSRQYLLWHNPSVVISRSQRFLRAGLHEFVLASNQTRLDWFAAIRHRIAHAQPHARGAFDNATMGLNGKRYQGARPGRFLRDWNIYVTPRARWLETISNELVNLSRQITP